MSLYHYDRNHTAKSAIVHKLADGKMMTGNSLRSASATGAAATTEKMVATAAMLKNFMIDASERSSELSVIF